METSETLLLTKRLYDGCPGCDVERKKMHAKRLPMKKLSVIAYLILVNSLPISSLYPFIYFMVRDFGIAKSDTRISAYAGYLGAAYMLGRFLSATPWGLISDRYGRKPVIVIGTVSIIVYNTLFGFSSNFWLAITWRFLLGFFSGMLGTIRAYVSEVCTEEQQATGLSVVGTMWGLGLILGPAIGGYLAQPSEQYPSLFASGSLFDLFPYALPCVCISMFAVIGIAPAIWLPETLHKHPTPSELSKEVNEDSEKNCVGDETEVKQDVAIATRRSLLRNKALMASICVYCLWGLQDMAYTEIFSLWAVSPVAYGGLGFSTSEVGDVLAGVGAALLVFQLSIFSRLAKFLGAIQIARIPAALTIPLLAIFPLIANLSGVALWVALVSAAMAKTILSICVVTGTFMWTNNSVVVAQRGMANGISMTFISLCKAIGPAFAGYLMSWAQQRMNASFLPGMWMVFTILDVFTLMALIATFEPILPSSVKKPVSEDTKDYQYDTALERSASFNF